MAPATERFQTNVDVAMSTVKTTLGSRVCCTAPFSDRGSPHLAPGYSVWDRYGIVVADAEKPPVTFFQSECPKHENGIKLNQSKTLVGHVDQGAFLTLDLATLRPVTGHEKVKKEHRILTIHAVAVLLLLMSALCVALSLSLKLGITIGGEVDVALPLFLILAVVLYRKAKRLQNTAKRLAQPSVEELLEKDRRPHVLYLRSFGIDAVLRHTLGGFFQRGTEEEQLIAALKKIGPVVAIGKPGDHLPELGAARVYLDDSVWQPEVTRLMDTAALVVLVLGPSGGLWWELKTVLARITPTRLIILSALTDVRMKIFRDKAQRELGLQLDGAPSESSLKNRSGSKRARELVEQGHQPMSWAIGRKKNGKWGIERSPLETYQSPAETDDDVVELTRIHSLHWFDDTRESHLQKVSLNQVPFFRRSLTHVARDTFLMAFEPVFETLRLEWNPPPFSVVRILLILAITSLFIAPILITLLELIGPF